MATCSPHHEGIIKSEEFIEYMDLRAEIKILEQDLVTAQTAVDFEYGFLPFEEVLS